MMKSALSTPSSGQDYTVQLSYPNQIGMFARIAHTIGAHGGDLGDINIVAPGSKLMTRGLNIRARNEDHLNKIIAAVRNLEHVKVVGILDPVLRMHQGGKISVQSKMPIASRETLSMAYTPGVARVSTAIAQDHSKVWSLTTKCNSVAVVSDGTAVLGLGDIGPEAAMPVMEGKAMLFKEFGDIDAYPICLKTKDPAQIVETVANLSVGFGGINLEDISAPRCFEIEEQLQQRLDIPVFHDDQHGTAIVVLAGLLNAVRLTGQKLSRIRITISGAGAAGMAITKMLLQSGAKDVIVCDRQGTLHEGRAAELNPSKLWLAQHTNPRRLAGSLEDALRGANVFIGVSAPGLLNAKAIKRMASKPIVFALSNPVPEIMPEEAGKHAFIVATGRSDYPNQINNVLAFPGVFRGALNVRAGKISDQMKNAAARAIAACVDPQELAPDHIVPSVFDRSVVEQVAKAVEQAAVRSGVAKQPEALVTRVDLGSPQTLRQVTPPVPRRHDSRKALTQAARLMA
ncbi:MAG TPA: NAD-dependent malic enzyme [Clostridia bacterium]|nr:NAD-dependent malic enzyme [Clostridia bacterium]